MKGFLSIPSVDDIDDQMVGLDINTEENKEFCFDRIEEEETNKFELCAFVGKFLMKKGVNTRAMKFKMADVWRPTMKIYIKKMVTSVFFFHFYHIKLICNGSKMEGHGPLTIPFLL